MTCEHNLIHVASMCSSLTRRIHTLCLSSNSTVTDSSVVAIQIFDQKKFKKRDQGFLGVINVRVADHIDLELGGKGEKLALTECSA